ncbi:MAG: HAD-IC family P-type ATPase [Frankiales bacterium]|nr:HAD-IC family P-type ATPase [Frankiales bacterium]
MTAGTAHAAREHHELPVHEVLLVLGADLETGLGEDEARERLEAYGPNSLPRRREHGPLVRLALQLHSPLVYVLLSAVVVTVAVGEYVDAAVILGVVAVNAVVGFVQEQRASAALEALADLARTRATVVRAGVVRRVDSTELVPGDIVSLEAGDKVPADLRLAEVHDLRVDESTLTGESEPVDKRALVLPAETAVADRLNMAWSSTLVTSGRALGVVVATGAQTEIGRIQAFVGSAQGVETPLMKRLAVFGRWLSLVIVVVAAVTFALGVARGESAAEMVTAAVALAVAAIPEGLPAAVTITLAIGVSRMARRNAIVRRLPAAETLGSTTVVCTDKTGTITQNRMTVLRVVVVGEEHELADAPEAEVRPCLVAGVLCSSARLREPRAGVVEAVGDPTETALLHAALARGVDQRVELAARPLVDEVPFSSDTGWMATLHEDPGSGGRLLVVKGGVEPVLALCGRADRGGALDAAAVEAQATTLGDAALRVLAFAWTRTELDRIPEDLTGTLGFLGLQAMADPLRPESAAAIAACRRAGIQVKMITGDHPRTAAAVAARAGLAGCRPPVVVTGADVAPLTLAGLGDVLERTDVVARVSAGQKLRIVEALQSRGHVVAMTGDGINDAPALKQADIGVAMGRNGTEVAKESAAMVLADDDFATIEAAVEEGRSIYDNLVKFVTWTLPTNIGEGLVVLAAIVAGLALPMTPVQILWVNMTTAVALGLMLAFEPAEPGIMTRRPRSPGEPIVTRHLVWRMVVVGLLMLVGAFVSYEIVLRTGATLEQARTVAVNAFVAMEAAYLVNCRSLDGSVRRVGLLSNRWVLVGGAAMLVLQALFTFSPWMQEAFGTAAPPAASWLLVLAMGVGLLAAVAGFKRATAPRSPTAAQSRRA